MNDNPNQIVDHLIGQYGVDGALETVREGIAAAKAKGDNYRLSVWREVRQVLQATPMSGYDAVDGSPPTASQCVDPF